MKQRIEYLDALRGFTMILVVFSHILLCTFQKPANSGFGFNDIFSTFFMPLFFFISGFLMYKPGRFIKWKDVMAFIANKFLTLIIPTLFFSLLFSIIFQRRFIDLMTEASKFGFWFTYTLFFFFFIYALGDHLIGQRLSKPLKCILGFLIAAIVYALAKYSLTPACPWHGSTVNHLLGFANFQHFLFFFFGAFVSKFKERFHSLLGGEKTMAGIISLFLFLQLIIQLPSCRGWLTGISFSFYSITKSFAALISVIATYAFFWKYHTLFKKDKLIGSTLQRIGIRSLDVYLLHLFLIYVNLAPVGKFFATYHNPVLELFAGLAGALLVIGLCLVISNIIRCSDFLAKYLFGKVIPLEK